MYGDCIGKDSLIGKYRVTGQLGSGGFATVYKVWDKHLNREYAMKVIHNMQTGSPNCETKYLCHLKHEGLPAIYDYFEANGCAYIVMELAKGISLKEYVKEKGKLSVEESLEVAHKVSKILKYLHERPAPVVHGDIKPENIMICDERVQLIDFGGAFSAYSSEAVYYGTPGYAAPELSKGKGGMQSDIYSFGKVLLYMLTGREGSLFRQEHFNEELKRYGVPKHFNKLILKCLNTDPGLRYQSGVELAKAMHALSGISRHLPGQGLVGFGFCLRAAGAVCVLLSIYKLYIHSVYGVEFLFVFGCILLATACVIGRYADVLYKSAILECECSLLVTEGL